MKIKVKGGGERKREKYSDRSKAMFLKKSEELGDKTSFFFNKLQQISAKLNHDYAFQISTKLDHNHVLGDGYRSKALCNLRWSSGGHWSKC